MSVAAINCCYRGCTQTAWSPRGGRLEAACSNATCVGCRRVALCVEHFEAVHQSQGDLACPNCGGERWHVCLFEPARLPAALSEAVEAAGGRLQIRPVPTTPDAADEPPAPTQVDALGARVLSRGPLTPAPAPRAEPPAEWRLLRASALDGARVVGRGLRVRGRELRQDGRPVALALGGDCRVAARPWDTPRPLVAEVVDASVGGHRLLWLDARERRGWLLDPHGGGAGGPAFLGPGEGFVFFAYPPGERAELRRCRFEGDRRLVSERLGAADVEAGAPPPTVVDEGRAVVYFERDAGGWRPLWRTLSDGHVTHLAEAGPAARAVAGGPHGAQVAWIDATGVVRRGGPGQAPTELGESDAALLAVSPDGNQVAWLCGGALHVRGPHAPTPQRYPVTGHVLHLEWAGP